MQKRRGGSFGSYMDGGGFGKTIRLEFPGLMEEAKCTLQNNLTNHA